MPCGVVIGLAWLPGRRRWRRRHARAPRGGWMRESVRGCLRSCPSPCEAGLICAITGAMSTRCDDTDLNDAAWAWIAPYLPAARPGGWSRTTNLRAVLNAIFYLLRTGCQWRLLPRSVPAPGHRLPLLSCLERCGRLGRTATGAS